MERGLVKLAVAITWLIMILGTGLYCAFRIGGGDAFESNIMALVPRPASHEWQPQPAEDADLQKRFLVLVRGDTGPRLATALRDTLAAEPGIVADAGSGSISESLVDFYRPYRHQVLSGNTRKRLEKLTPEELARETFRALHSPVPELRPHSLREDPFNLAGEWLQSLSPGISNMTPGDIPAVRDGSHTWYLVRARLRDSPFTPTSQRAVTGALAAFASEYPDARLLHSGFVFHAAEATETARREISTVGLGSLLGIAVLVTAIFRSGRAVLAIAATLAGSVLLALAASLAVFERVHLITLAFGTTLLGLSVDYCFHFLMKCRRLGSGLAAGKVVARGLILSAGSSILAYLVQLFSPFPGLQQFAVFVAFGLVGACITLVFLAFYYRDNGPPPRSSLFEHGVAPVYRRLARHRALCVSVLLLVMSVAAVQLARYGFSDDIRLLNPSSDTLIEEEIRVSTLLGGIDTQRYWVVEGSSRQQVLERTEALLSSFPPGLEVAAVTDLVPSLRQQKRDHRLVMDKLYGPGAALDSLCENLGSDCDAWKSQDFGFRAGLVPQRIPAAIADEFPVLAMAETNYTPVFPWQGQSLTPAELSELALPEGVRFVDRIAELSHTLAGFRVQVTALLALFLLLFSALSLALYRTSGIRAATSVLVSLVGALALSAGGGITLFHVLALLLVTGIAIDTAVFYEELGLTQDSWLAATLATFTSVLAFGLLSLSRVPVLQQFGTVVFYGLICAWLVTPLLYMLGKPDLSKGKS